MIKEVRALFGKEGEPSDDLRNGFQFGGGTGTHGAKPADEHSFKHWSDRLLSSIKQDLSLVGNLLKS